MRCAADTGRSHRQRAGLGFGQRNEILHTAHRQRRMRHQHIGRIRHQRDRCKIAQRVVRHFGKDTGIDRHRRRRNHQCVAIGRGLRRQLRAQHATRAGAILHNHRLAHLIREFLREKSPHNIAAAAGRAGHDHAQRFLREGLCVYHTSTNPGQQQQSTSHDHGLTVMFAARATLVNSAISRLINCANSSGVLSTISEPVDSKRSRISGDVL